MCWTNRFVAAGLCIVSLCVEAAAPEAGNATLRVGAAKRDITPDPKLSNWVTHKPYNEVLEPVYARAVVVDQGVQRFAIVSWELLYPMEEAVAKVRKAVHEKTGIPQGNILVCATHNHSAPWSPPCGHPLTKAEQKVLHSFLNDTNYPAWERKVFENTVEAVVEADKARLPATLSIGRGYVGDILFNRRPIRPDGKVQTLTGVTNAFVMPDGLRFGKVDPTVTLLLVRDAEGKSIVTLYHMACHAVVVYPKYDGISGDWPGATSAILEKELGGEAMFLQGCAGDINPIKRGLEARDHIAKTVAERVVQAARATAPLDLKETFKISRNVVEAPVREDLRQELERETLPAEVQVLTCGSLAIVGLPGEPLTALSWAIQDASPFSHTLVMGYSNGLGTQYVGLPGEKARGGYEMGVRNLGTDDCGQLLVDTAVALLKSHAH